MARGWAGTAAPLLRGVLIIGVHPSSWAGCCCASGTGGLLHVGRDAPMRCGRRGAAIRGGRRGEQQRCAATAAMRLRGLCPGCVAAACTYTHAFGAPCGALAPHPYPDANMAARLAVRHDTVRVLAAARACARGPAARAGGPTLSHARSRAVRGRGGTPHARGVGARRGQRRRASRFIGSPAGPFPRCSSAAHARRSALCCHGGRVRADCGARGAGVCAALAFEMTLNTTVLTRCAGAGADARRQFSGPGRRRRLGARHGCVAGAHACRRSRPQRFPRKGSFFRRHRGLRCLRRHLRQRRHDVRPGRRRLRR